MVTSNRSFLAGQIPGLLLKEAGGSPAEVLLLTGNCLPVTQESGISVTCWMATSAGSCPVAEFTLDICHIAGAANVVAETLSRQPGHMAAASLSGDLCKSNRRVSGCRPAGRQAKFLSTFIS